MQEKPALKAAMVGFLGLLTFTIIFTITHVLWPALFDGFEARTIGWRYPPRLENLKSERYDSPIEEIIIVDIDNRSLEKLGRFNQWPRNYHAQIIDYISSGGALALAFDVLFMEPDADPKEDSSLISATGQSNIVYHAMSFSQADSNNFLYEMRKAPDGFNTLRYSMNPSKMKNIVVGKVQRMDGKIVGLYNKARGIGFANFLPDNDGVVRAMPMFVEFAGQMYPSLSMSVVMGVLGADFDNVEITAEKGIKIHPPGSNGKLQVDVPTDKNCRMLINYMGTFQTFRYISYYDVLMKRIPPETFAGRIVLVGTSVAGLSDIHPVPFQDAFAGVEIHANIIYNILTQKFISKPDVWLSLTIYLVLSILIALIAMYLRPWLSTILWLIIGGGYIYATVFLFTHYAIWLEIVRPIISISLAILMVFMYRYAEEERRKKHIQGMFQHYLSESVVYELLKNPDMLKLGGEKRIATAFFSDIKSFTTVSERLAPEELVAHLNEYLSAMSEIILKYDGYIDKYEGDAIMAVFGIPLNQEDHATRACMAALEMQATMVKLRTKWRTLNKPEFHIRIGINSGPMIAGNIGGKHRFDYTVIGDSVNLAARLETANKNYGTHIMVSEFTRDLLDQDIVTRELDILRVKGKNKPVRVYELVAPSYDSLIEKKKFILEYFNNGLTEYRKHNWDSAIALFNRVLTIDANDIPAQGYIERCEFYKNNLVPEDWDGVFEMTTGSDGYLY